MIGEWLFEEIKKINELLVVVKLEKVRLLEMATKITAGMDGMPHGSGVTDKVGNGGAKLAQLSDEEDALEARRDKLLGMVKSLPADQCGVLYRYYIQGMTLEKVAEDMNISVSSAKRYKKAGLEMLEKMRG
jgi:DNA-directed RNA polymerase specialized sigma subunit